MMSSLKSDARRKRSCCPSMFSRFTESSDYLAVPGMNPEKDNERNAAAVTATRITLHEAAREGDIEMLDKLLERLPQKNRKKILNQCDECKLTPLHYAARYNQKLMIEALLKNGADVHAAAEDGSTPLHILAKCKEKLDNDVLISTQGAQPVDETSKIDQMSCVDLLVRSGARVSDKDANGLTPLHRACARGNAGVVRQLLRFRELCLEATDQQGTTPLHLACLNGNVQIVRMLLESEADLRCRDKEMTTPMHIACSEGSIEIAQILFRKAEENQMAVSGSDTETAGTSNVAIRKLSLSAIQHFGVQNATPILARRQGKDSVGGSVLLEDMDNEKNLPLHLAIQNGNLSLANFCMDKGKRSGIGNMVNTTCSHNNSCLHLAVQANSLELVKLVLHEGADINARNASQATPLYVACQQNSHGIVNYLLSKGCDVEMRDVSYKTPFLIASRHGHLETLSWLLQYNADVAAIDKDDKTCLMLAAEENKPDTIRLLMQNNTIAASLEERDKSNNTALHLAAGRGHSDTVKLLLEYHASTESKNDSDQNTLHMAALHGHHAIIPDLVNRDKSIMNTGDEEANTVLHLAAIGGNLKCVTVLIQLGADVNLRNANQWTALDCACAFGYVKPAKALLKAGAPIEPFGKIKISPLHLACQRGHMEVVNLLLEWKADVSFRSIDGRNALDYAIDFGQRSCVLTLIKHETWKESLKNAYVYSRTGHSITPMRKLIMKMEDMAEIVCNQCLQGNGKKKDDDNFSVTMLYELLDDGYSSSRWMANTETGNRAVTPADDNYNVYDETGHVTDEAYSYYDESCLLRRNHPLMLMVRAKCNVLLKHPVVLGLLSYKWQKFGRYVYYIGLIIYLIYLVALNVFMEQIPFFYQIDWLKMLERRKVAAGVISASSAEYNISTDSMECIYYRRELLTLSQNPQPATCVKLGVAITHLEWTLLILSAFNLGRELLQFLMQLTAYVTFMNVVTVVLYLLTLLLTLDFPSYQLRDLPQLTNSNVNNSELIYLQSVQKQTGLRQQWQEEIGAFSVFLSWMVLLLYIRKLPKFGIFVVMFTDVLKTFAKFSLFLFLLLLGFALTYSILLGNQKAFHYWYWSYVTVAVMMAGEVNYQNTFFQVSNSIPVQYFLTSVYSRHVSVVVFVISIVVVVIVIMNLLVGLAVGDIMEVQENASLERFQMQVDLALEVEFSLPEFLRKKFCICEQAIEINKYRKANFFKKLFLQNQDLSAERIVKYLDKNETEPTDYLNNMERIIGGVDVLKNKVEDLLIELTDAKQDLRNVQDKVLEVKIEAQKYAEDIHSNVRSTKDILGERIETSHSSQIETTHEESTHTRDDVDDTKMVVRILQADAEKMRRETLDLIVGSEKRLMAMQKRLLEQQQQKLNLMQECYFESVQRGRREIMDDMETVQLLLVKSRQFC